MQPISSRMRPSFRFERPSPPEGVWADDPERRRYRLEPFESLPEIQNYFLKIYEHNTTGSGQEKDHGGRQ
jgi:hypothetical protein